ncbi:DUF2007 domain-containing protein [Phragmitibacter flavus]|uniref:DUF2007 domain-containing protein n=1 Tax=Phragmitibacter flavus TaxID=2576071 RepID=A0A5R8KAM3_9BACT|nr:DUF2007 domain-containing protein [Phragmitibacter flavus]TLD69364.1 DUF2007 domain-containing protein [Phragmitibacter flavus]
MNTIARFQTPEDAHLFRLFLGSHEIEAFVFDEFTVQTVWKFSNAIGGVRVVVHHEDVPAAATYYQEYWQTVLSSYHHTPPVRAWPLILILSLLIGAQPFIVFGRQPLIETD